MKKQYTGAVIIIVTIFILWSATIVNFDVLIRLKHDPVTTRASVLSVANTTAAAAARWLFVLGDRTVEVPLLTDPFRYSSFSCVQPLDEHGSTNTIYPDFTRRTCQFQNLYFDRHSREFHYFVSPKEEQLLQKDFEENKNNYIKRIKIPRNQRITLHHVLQDMLTVSWSYILTKDIHRQIAKTPLLPDDHWNVFRWHPIIHFYNQTEANQIRWGRFRLSTTLQDHQQKRHRRQLRRQETNRQKQVLLLYHPSYSFNFGHFLLDDVATWFQMLQAFGHIAWDSGVSGKNPDDSIVPIPIMMDHTEDDPYYRCRPQLDSRWHLCMEMYRRLLPQILHIENKVDDDILLRLGNLIPEQYQHKAFPPRTNSSTLDLVRLDQHLIVGSGRLPHYACDGSCSIGRMTWMPLFRLWMMRQLLLPSRGPTSSSSGRSSSSIDSPVTLLLRQELNRHVKKAHDYITFSLPFNNTRAPGLSNFEGIINMTRMQYGDERVQVVNLANLTLADQAWLMLHTCVFFTYEGGGSHTSIFLPPGATIVLYNSNPKKFNGTYDIRNYRDKAWYDSLAQVQKVWVSANDRENVTLAKIILDLYATTHTTLRL